MITNRLVPQFDFAVSFNVPSSPGIPLHQSQCKFRRGGAKWRRREGGREAWEEGRGHGELYRIRHHFTAPNTDKNWTDSVISHSPEGRVGARVVM